MSKLYKNIFWIFAVIVVMVLYYGGIVTGRTLEIVIPAAILLWLLLSVEKRVNRIEEAINMPADKSDTVESSKPVSYRLSVSIAVDWIGVIRNCFPELKDKESAWQFIEKLMNDEELKIDGERSLFDKEFGFTQFHDGVSGLMQIWSNHYNNFVRDLIVIGDVLDSGFMRMYERFPDNKIARGITITPEYIGFRSNLPDGEVLEEDKISQIPFWDIVHFFSSVYKQRHYDTPSYDVKSFPRRLREKLEKHEVKYETTSGFDFNENVTLPFGKDDSAVISRTLQSMHKFEGPLHSVFVEMEFFE